MRGQMLKLCAAILAALPFFVILPPSRRAHAQTGVYAVQLPPTADEGAFANAFRNRPGVTFAELDSVVAPQDITPNDPSYPSEWHLSKISAPAAWSTTTGS